MNLEYDNNNFPEHHDIFTGSSETETILEAVRNVCEKALKEGKNTFTWREVEEVLNEGGFSSSYIGFYWFRVMTQGRNATSEQEKENPNGPTSRYPGSKALDDTGDFVKPLEDTEVTEENYQNTPLTITEKSYGILYRV